MNCDELALFFGIVDVLVNNSQAKALKICLKANISRRLRTALPVSLKTIVGDNWCYIKLAQKKTVSKM